MNEATGRDREQKIVDLVDAVERLTAARGALEGQEMDSDGITEQIVELDDELLRELGAGTTRRTTITYDIESDAGCPRAARCTSIAEALREHDAASRADPDARWGIVARVWALSRVRELDELEIEILVEAEADAEAAATRTGENARDGEPTG